MGAAALSRVNGLAKPQPKWCGLKARTIARFNSCRKSLTGPRPPEGEDEMTEALTTETTRDTDERRLFDMLLAAVSDGRHDDAETLTRAITRNRNRGIVFENCKVEQPRHGRNII